MRARIKFFLDTPEPVSVNLRDCLLTGWAFTPGTSLAPEIWIEADGRRYYAFVGFSRPDVGAYFGDEKVSNCGFVIRFARYKSFSGLRLFGRNDGPEQLLHEFSKLSQESDSVPNGKPSNYLEWIKRNEPEMFLKPEDALDFCLSLKYRPRISIILPTYNTPRYFLSRCIRSVMDQFYDYWELSICDDNSSDPEILQTLRAHEALDSRIRVITNPVQGGISVASNLALANCTGDYVVFLDHDDELHPYALLEVASALNEGPDYDYIYSDEDKINRYGFRSEPAFKPDFDKNIFLSFNFLGHLAVIKRSILRQLGGFRPTCDGAQDWDLLMRVLEIIPENAIKHICKPLYHWRIHDSSTSFDIDAKPYVRKAWVYVLEERARRTGAEAKVEPGLFDGSMRLHYAASARDGVAVILRPEDGIFQTSIVRSNSSRCSVTLYNLIGCSLYRASSEDCDSEPGEPAEHLASAYEIPEDVLVFINGELEVINHLFFEELIGQCMRPDVAVVTGMALDSRNTMLSTALLAVDDDTLEDPFAGTVIPDGAYMWQAFVVRCVEAVTAMFFAVRREIFRAVGGMGALSASHMDDFARSLSMYAHEHNLSAIYTPYAIASFSSGREQSAPFRPVRPYAKARKANANMLSFPALLPKRLERTPAPY